jgi:microcystin-dependent protein
MTTIIRLPRASGRENLYETVAALTDELERTLATAGAGEPGPPGPQGPPGTPGEQWYQGTGAPAGTLGIVGDWYLDTANGDMYEKTGASTWTFRLHVIGPTGAQGAPGAPGEKWFTGSGAPAAATGAVNDWYLDSTNGDYYEKTGASAWTLRGNLRGATGATGATGPQGPMGPMGTVYDTDQVGTVKAFSGTTVPTNWMLADGRSLLRTDYPDLFTAIGTTYGAVDGTHFNLPDLRNRMIYGATALNLAGGTGGEAAHALTKAELASHDHGGATGTPAQAYVDAAGAHGHGVNDPWHNHSPGDGQSFATMPDMTLLGNTGTQRMRVSNMVGTTAGSPTGISIQGVGDHQHIVHFPASSIAADGNGVAHQNLPPYILIAQIIKVTGVQINPGGALVGPQGAKGDTGATGAQGPQGATGPMGTVYDSDQIGTIKTFSGKTIPTNWMLADGRAVSRTTYPELFTALGTMYGAGDGSTTFNIPDLRSKMIYGASDPNSQGATGGEAAHTLTAAESGMPAHSFTPQASSRINQQPAYNTGGNVPVPPGYDQGGAKYPMTDTVNIGGVSAAQAHNNLPPYVLIAQIIKVTGVQIDSGGALVGATGPPGASGQLAEYVFRSGAGTGAGVNVSTAGAFLTLPLPASPTITPSGAFTQNADNSVTVRDAGWYSCSATLNNGTASVIAYISIGKSPNADSGSDGAKGGVGGGSWGTNPTATATFYCNAGDRIYVCGSANAGANLSLTYLSIHRAGAGPPGPQGPAGASGVPTYGTSFPASPGDGAEHILVDSVTNPSYQWRFRYNAGSTSPYKWECSGGATPFVATVATAENHPGPNGSWQNLATQGPSIVLPRSGDYEVAVSVRMNKTQAIALSGYAGPAIGDTAPSLAVTWQDDYTASGPMSTPSATYRLTALTGGTTLKMRYFSGTGSGSGPWMQFSNRWLLVRPIRCS